VLRPRDREERALEVALPLEGEREGDGVREGERYRGIVGFGVPGQISKGSREMRGSSGPGEEAVWLTRRVG
jgi:hypothetical protein